MNYSKPCRAQPAPAAGQRPVGNGGRSSREPLHWGGAVDLELDAGIAAAVEVLQNAGVATYESCQGGEGHSFPEPTVRFGGSYAEGITALGVALAQESRLGLRVYQLRRVWRMDNGELTGPWWDLVFRGQLYRHD